MRAVLVCACLVALVAGHPTLVRAADEPPALAERVVAGTLPGLAERLPRTPRRDTPGRSNWTAGRYGGELRLLARGGRDPRDMVVLGYARLLVWDEDYRLVPDILEGVQVEEDRIFTLHLRPGHRWSDGHPFTAEDFRFWWQDVAGHALLAPAGPPPEMLVAGAPPRFEVLSETSVRYIWPAPNPRFLPALAATSPPFIYRPAHYLKRFHARYTDPQALAAAAAAEGLRDWAALYRRRDHPFLFDNPDLPTLQPWINTTAPPADRYVGLRNPYFHRVDGEGRQLPYIDRLLVIRSQPRLIPVQTAAGESGLQASGLGFRDFTLLKESEARSAIAVRLWPSGRGAQLALYPNLNAADPLWRELLRTADFRRALSLALDRDEINRIVFQGLAVAGGNSLLPASPMYRAAYRRAWADFDPARANRLLDRLGLARAEADGIRRLPDGRRLALVVESGDSDPAEVDVLELIADAWRNVGVELLIRSTGRQALRQRIQGGETVMSIFYGLTNGLAAADMSPAELVPSSDKQNNWPLWGRYMESGGRAGAAPDLPEVLRLLDLFDAWTRAKTDEERRAAWQEMLAIHADQVFTIGIVAQVPQPVVADARLRNVPERAYYLWEPGAYFGLFRPDTFWFE